MMRKQKQYPKRKENEIGNTCSKLDEHGIKLYKQESSALLNVETTPRLFESMEGNSILVRHDCMIIPLEGGYSCRGGRCWVGIICVGYYSKVCVESGCRRRRRADPLAVRAVCRMVMRMMSMLLRQLLRWCHMVRRHMIRDEGSRRREETWRRHRLVYLSRSWVGRIVTRE
jgi:hypothetical protein